MAQIGGKITRSVFKDILDKGQGFYSPFFNLKVLKVATGATKPVFKVVVSAKVAKKAHDRNLIKRRIKSVVYGEGQKVKTDLMFIIFTKPGLKDKNFAIIKADLLKILSDSGIFLK